MSANSVTASAQLRRILEIIPRLSDGESHKLSEVAKLAGAGIPDLLRDIRAIAERFDDPGGFVEGIQIFVESENVSVMSAEFRRPMRLTMGELSALDLGLALLKAESLREDQAPIDRARARLRKAITHAAHDEQQERARHAEMGVAAGDPAHLDVLRKAVREQEKVQLSYRGSSAAKEGDRVICPYALAFSNGMWYVVAHCERSADVRFFRLDRIVNAEPVGSHFRKPEDFALDPLLEQGRALHAAEPGAVKHMRVRYSARIAPWVAEREGRAVDMDGSLTLEHLLLDMEWAVRHVLQYGAEAEVLSPESVRAAVRERVEGILAEGSQEPNDPKSQRPKTHKSL